MPRSHERVRDDPAQLREQLAVQAVDGTAAVEAIRGDELACLVAKVEPVGPKSFHMDLHMLENRFEFQRALRPDPQGAPS